MDNLIDEPLAAKLQMIAGHGQEMQTTALVQRAQSDPILHIDRRLAQRNDHVRLTRQVELKVLRLPGLMDEGTLKTPIPLKVGGNEKQ